MGFLDEFIPLVRAFLDMPKHKWVKLLIVAGKIVSTLVCLWQVYYILKHFDAKYFLLYSPFLFISSFVRCSNKLNKIKQKSTNFRLLPLCFCTVTVTRLSAIKYRNLKVLFTGTLIWHHPVQEKGLLRKVTFLDIWIEPKLFWWG